MDLRNGSIFESVDRNEILEQSCKSSFFLRNQDQETPLSVAIQSHADKSIHSLLEYGAAASVFVQSYSSHGLVCTLPMALQPESSCFEYPPPLTGVDSHVVELIDEKLAEYVDELVDKQKEKEKGNDLLINIGCPSTVNPGGSLGAPPFDHYPATLKVGDVVRRGPQWTFGSQDEQNGVPLAGVVMNAQVSMSWGSYQVQWRTNPSDPNTAVATYQYDYDPSNLTIYLVDTSNPKAVPKGLKSPSAPYHAAKFKPGDKVRLVNQCLTSTVERSKNTSNSVVTLLSSQCLGTDSLNLVGIITGVKKELYKGSKTPRARPFAPGEEDNVVTVMSVHSGVKCDYASSDLRYADGSAPGKNVNELEPPQITAFTSKSITPVISPGRFKSGDRVRLRKNATVLNGCLGNPKDKWVGQISSTSGFIFC